jgi:hypothetical protein
MKNVYDNSADQLCFNKVDLSSTVAAYPKRFYLYSAEKIKSNFEDILFRAGSHLSANYILSRMIAENFIEDSHIQTIFIGQSIETIASKYEI